jgi:hypothetical protein
VCACVVCRVSCVVCRVSCVVCRVCVSRVSCGAYFSCLVESGRCSRCCRRAASADRRAWKSVSALASYLAISGHTPRMIPSIRSTISLHDGRWSVDRMNEHVCVLPCVCVRWCACVFARVRLGRTRVLSPALFDELTVRRDARVRNGRTLSLLHLSNQKQNY